MAEHPPEDISSQLSTANDAIELMLPVRAQTAGTARRAGQRQLLGAAKTAGRRFNWTYPLMDQRPQHRRHDLPAPRRKSSLVGGAVPRHHSSTVDWACTRSSGARPKRLSPGVTVASYSGARAGSSYGSGTTARRHGHHRTSQPAEIPTLEHAHAETDCESRKKSRIRTPAGPNKGPR